MKRGHGRNDDSIGTYPIDVYLCQRQDQDSNGRK